MNTDPPNSPVKDHDLDRRAFVKAAGILGAAAAVGAGALIHAKTTKISNEPTGDVTIRKLPARDTIPVTRDSDPLLRMQKELEGAMAKPVEQRHWMMVIDTRKCIGCHACTIACVVENKLPPGVVYRPVVTEEIGTYPNLAIRFTPRPCMQCDVPPCTPVCPVKATWKRPDGIVAIDYDKCIGCGYCVTACPYNARPRDLGEHHTDGTPALQPYESSRTSNTASTGTARATARRWATPASASSVCTGSSTECCPSASRRASGGRRSSVTPTIPTAS
jgi:Fe-S-cluster-containing dehydrogenase component